MEGTGVYMTLATWGRTLFSSKFVNAGDTHVSTSSRQVQYWTDWSAVSTSREGDDQMDYGRDSERVVLDLASLVKPCIPGPLAINTRQ